MAGHASQTAHHPSPHPPPLPGHLPTAGTALVPSPLSWVASAPWTLFWTTPLSGVCVWAGCGRAGGSPTGTCTYPIRGSSRRGEASRCSVGWHTQRPRGLRAMCWGGGAAEGTGGVCGMVATNLCTLHSPRGVHPADYCHPASLCRRSAPPTAPCCWTSSCWPCAQLARSD